MPGAIAAMAEAYRMQQGISEDVSMKDLNVMLRKAMEKGQVKSDILPYFAEVVSSRTPEQLLAMERASQSSLAEQNRFKNAWSATLELMSDGGLEKAFYSMWKTFAEEMERGTNSAESFAKAFDKMLSPIKAGAKLIGDVADVWIPRLSRSLGIGEDKVMFFGLAIGSLFIPIARWVTILGALTLVVEDVSKGFQGMNSWTKQMLDYIGGGDFQTGIDRIIVLTTALVGLVAAIKAVRAAGKISDIFTGKDGKTLGDRVMGRGGVQKVFVTNWPPSMGGGVGSTGKSKSPSKVGKLGVMAAGALGAGFIQEVFPNFWQGGNEAIGNFIQNTKFTDYKDMYSKATSANGANTPISPSLTFGDIKVDISVDSLSDEASLQQVGSRLADTLRQTMREEASSYFSSQLNVAGMSYSNANIE